MLNKLEILEHARKYNLPANTIEKDYILNWILAGISSSAQLKDTWIFKGGTCLKKCYFEEYRFSEDLDFTITESSHINASFLINKFTDISEWIYENSGIEVPVTSMKFEEVVNPRGNISIAGKLAYKGPMQRRGNNPTIKLDLSCDEIIIEPSVLKPIYHPYSDFRSEIFSINTYSLEEIFAEKLRALTQRMSPRDLYDVIHLHNDSRWSLNKETVLTILEKKCDFKSVQVPTMSILNDSSNKNDLIADWDDMLAHQIAGLEPYEYYWNRLPLLFKWLQNS